jgi:hypothetical protein
MLGPELANEVLMFGKLVLLDLEKFKDSDNELFFGCEKSDHAHLFVDTDESAGTGIVIESAGEARADFVGRCSPRKLTTSWPTKSGKRLGFKSKLFLFSHAVLLSTAS